MADEVLYAARPGRADHLEPAGLRQRAELRDDLRAGRGVRPGGERRRGGGAGAGRGGQALLRRARHRHPGAGRGHVLRPRGRAVVGPRGQGGRRRQVRPRDGGLPGHVPALAGDPQAVHRDGARRLHRRRADARLGVRPDRGGRRRVLRRPGGQDGYPGRGVLRAPLGARAAVREGGAVHRGAVRRRAGLPGGHGEPGGAARGPGGDHVRPGRADRADAAVRPRAGQAGGQPVRGPDGAAAGDGFGVRPAPRGARAQRRVRGDSLAGLDARGMRDQK